MYLDSLRMCSVFGRSGMEWNGTIPFHPIPSHPIPLHQGVRLILETVEWNGIKLV